MNMDEILEYGNLVKALNKTGRNKKSFELNRLSKTGFSGKLKQDLDKIIFEVKNNLYRPMPIKIIEKGKEIALLSFRDKVLQNAVAEIIAKEAEKYFIETNYGYRVGKSVYQAIDYINLMIQKKGFKTFYKGDILNFFGNINHEILLHKVKCITRNDEITKLIALFIAPDVLLNGRIFKKEQGLLLGSPISPLLSNIYLMDMDRLLSDNLPLYVRYADDILIGLKNGICKTEVDILEKELKKLGLQLNQNKSCQVDIKNGFTFLGHEFKDEYGNDSIRGSIQLLEEDIIGDQYDRILKYINYIADIQNLNLDHIIELVRDNGGFRYAILLLIIFVRNNLDVVPIYEKLLKEKLELEKVCMLEEMIREVKDIDELLQNIVDFLIKNGLYSLAQELNIVNDDIEHRYVFKTELKLPDKFLRLFQGRKDTYARGYSDANGNKYYYKIHRNLTETEIMNMIEDKYSIGIYPLTEENKCRFYVLDIDMDKRIIMEHGDNSTVYMDVLEKARNYALKIQKILLDADIISYIEFSGLKGYHLWIFFNDFVDVEKIKKRIESLIRKVEAPPGIHLEMIPSMTYDEDEIVKIPLSYHELSYKRAAFIGRSSNSVKEQLEYIDKMIENSPDVLEEEINYKVNHIDDKVNHVEETDNDKKPVKKDINDFCEEITNTYKSCSLMKYIVDKCFAENYINHFERNALLYVFGHIKSEGREFLHFVISRCINYDYEVTEGFISRIKEKPVSCQKLQMRFKQICDKVQCNCKFDDYPLYYASPVIYACMVCPDEVTKPEYYDQGARIAEISQINEQIKINKLVKSLIELSKSKREIEKQLKSCCEELEYIFQKNDISEYETESGKLIKKQNEWYLRIT